MPKLSTKLPSYRRHSQRDVAFVELAGRRFYLPGKFGSAKSKQEYHRVCLEWEIQGRPEIPASEPHELTVIELCAKYWQFAQQHYRKRDKGTSEIDNIKCALRPLKELYGRTPVHEFGPLALKALQLRMIDDGLSRGVINGRIGKIKRVFRWAVSEELAPPSLMHALSSVMGLQKGRTKAREASAITPVDEVTVEATLTHLSSVVADMVRVQRLTGCRPGEVCAMRPVEIERTSDVWLYSPGSHKTEHHGKSRIIAIGPKAQEILLPYLLRDAEACCFSPADSERKRKAEMRENRKSKVQPSQQDRSKRNAQRKPSGKYTSEAYALAIYRACDKAKIDHWSPNQLRHSAATEIRKRFGLEAAQVTLGHASADVSQIYAQRDMQKAIEVMREVG